MDVKITSEVYCEGEKAGEVTCVIINPDLKKMTHIIVQEKDFPYTEKIVHLEKVVKAEKARVELNCTSKDLSNLEDYVKLEFVPVTSDMLGYSKDEVAMTYSNVVETHNERIPLGEMSIRQGLKVFASDGEVGEIDDFLTESKEKGQVSHIVLLEGHFWNVRNISIPVTEINKVDDKGIYLNLSKDEIGKLPSVKAHNWFS